MKFNFGQSLLIITSLLIAGCSGPSVYRGETQDGGPDREIDINSVPNAIPKAEPRSRYGNPESYVVFGKTYRVMDSAENFTQRGIASWYGSKFHGRRTSSGEPYDMYAMTAAHKNLPLPTYVEVTNIENGRKIIVKVNDRGPFHQNRIIDLSYVAAAKLDIARKGTGLVEIRALTANQPLSGKITNQPIDSQNTAVKQAVASVQPALDEAAKTLQVNTTTINPHPKIYLQTGAFANKQNAERMQQQLQQSLGTTVRLSELAVGDRLIYRVQVGPFQAVQQADAFTEKLNQQGITSLQTIIE